MRSAPAWVCEKYDKLFRYDCMTRTSGSGICVVCVVKIKVFDIGDVVAGEMPTLTRVRNQSFCSSQLKLLP